MKNNFILSEGWANKLATIVATLLIFIFIILGIYWKINPLYLILISVGGFIGIWWLIVLIIDGINILINFIKTGRI